MSKSINVLKKYLTDENKINIVDKKKLTLENWQELEEAALEAKKVYPNVGSATGGNGRAWDCLIGEIESAIKSLGGKLYKERENNEGWPPNWLNNCALCEKQYEEAKLKVQTEPNKYELKERKECGCGHKNFKMHCSIGPDCPWKLKYINEKGEELNEKGKKHHQICRGGESRGGNMGPQYYSVFYSEKNQPNICENCQRAVKSLECWEVNRKKNISSSCNIGRNNPYAWHEIGQRVKDWVIHNKCWKAIKKNEDGDIEPCGCSNISSQELLEGTPQNKLRSYFITNKVNRVSRKLGELKVEYLDGRSKIIGSETESKDYDIIYFLEENNKNSLDRNDLEIKEDMENAKPSKKMEFLNQLEGIFTQNNIKLIEKIGNKLIIEFNEENSTQNNQLTSEQQEQISNYLTENNRQSLSLRDIREEREREREREQNPFSWTPLIIGGSVLLGIIAIVAIVLSRMKNKKLRKV